MTDVVIATRSGIVTAPDGSKHRLVRGRTLADARHPAAVAFPEMFAQHTIDLPYAGPDDAEAERDGYRQQLATIVDAVTVRGLMPADVDMGVEGWLVGVLSELLDRCADPVAPPAAAKRGPGRPRKSAASEAGRAEE
jgi:hypothetical protein